MEIRGRSEYEKTPRQPQFPLREMLRAGDPVSRMFSSLVEPTGRYNFHTFWLSTRAPKGPPS
ncbi:unnamed protein product, partial [Nesidiocoris tenuis]